MATLAAAAGIVACAVICAGYGRAWLEVSPRLAATSDYAPTYAAGTLWGEGRGSLVYDEGAEIAQVNADGGSGQRSALPYDNPPAAMVVAAPLTALSLVAAYRLFGLLQVSLLVAALIVVARAAPWGRGVPTLAKVAAAGVAMAGLGTGDLLLEGQWDGLSALAIALAYAGLCRHRDGSAGWWSGLLGGLAKPHLLVGVAAWAIGGRRWQLLGAAAAGMVLTAAVAVLAVGPGSLSAYARAMLAPATSPPAQMQSMAGLLGSWLGESAAVVGGILALTVVGLVGMGWWARWAQRREVQLEVQMAVATLGSLFLAPHLLVHDLVILGPAVVWMIAVATRRRRCAGWLAGVIAWWWLLGEVAGADLGNRGVGPPGRLVPWLLVAGLVGLGVVAHRAPTPGQIRQDAAAPAPRLSVA